MATLLQTIEWERDPREQRNLQLKKQSLQDELTGLRQRLADASKVSGSEPPLPPPPAG